MQLVVVVAQATAALQPTIAARDVRAPVTSSSSATRATRAKAMRAVLSMAIVDWAQIVSKLYMVTVSGY